MIYLNVTTTFIHQQEALLPDNVISMIIMNQK